MRDEAHSMHAMHVAIWEHDNRHYEYISMYSVASDCWVHELTERAKLPGEQPVTLALTIPDASPDSPSFAPAPAAEVTFAVSRGCEVPWLILSRFLETVYATGDIPRTV
jgi:hypothetical protein